MPNDLTTIKEVIELIINDLPRMEEEKETLQNEIKETLETLINAQGPLINSIKNTVTKLIPSDNNDLLKTETDKLELIKQYYYLNSSIKNPLEELEFNYLLYKIDNPLNLFDCLDNIKEYIDKFKKMNVIITEKDFKYSYLVDEFMQNFFSSYSNPDFYNIMKLVFDKLYWKNHNLLKDISINLKDILNDKIKEINIYTIKLKNDFITNFKIDEQNIRNNYLNYYTNVERLTNISPTRIFNLFKNNEYNIEEFIDDSPTLITHRSKFILTSEYDNLNEQQVKEFYLNIIDLNFNIYEYENFEKYKFILDDIKSSLEKKATIATELTTKNKTINTLKAKNKKNNQQITKLLIEVGKLKNNEKKLEKLTIKLNDLIAQNDEILNQTRTEYENYDELLFEEKLCKSINENMTIFDVYNIYKENLNSLRKLIVKKEKEIIPEEDLIDLLSNFKNFLNDPRLKIINRINYTKPEDIDKIIEEKYKLSGIDIDITDINNPQFIELKKSCDFLVEYYNIYESGWTPYIIKIKIDYFEQ